MSVSDSKWESFKKAARAIIDRHRDFFELQRVEPAPRQVKSASGYAFNIEVVAYAKGDERLVLFECRRKGRNITPEEAGGIAYRIGTTGAKKGFFVTRLTKRLSKGAKKIADSEKIGHIQLSADATPDEYVMQYLDTFFASVVSKWKWTSKVRFEVRDSEGNILERG